jgi:plastocyanin
MPFTLDSKKAYIGLGLAAVIIFGVLFFSNKSTAPESPQAVENANQPAGQNGGAQPAVQKPAGQSGQAAKPAAPKTTGPASQLGVSFVTPVTGDVWPMNESHPIVWNKEAKMAGGLYLADSKGAVVGWLVPSTGANQTSYAWDTRDVSVDRTGGNRKNIASGMYSVKLVLDGKSGEVSSVPFSIVAQGASGNVSYTVRLRDTKVSPNVLTVPRGAKVVFINNDARIHSISGDGIQPFKVPANGGTYVLDTAGMEAKTYNWLSDVYTYQAPGTLIVK